MTSSAPRNVRRNYISHSLASTSRWFVGSSSSRRSLAREEDARQLDPAPLTTRERGDREVEAVGREAEPGGDAPHLRLGRVPAGHAERVLRVAVRLHVPRRRIGVDAACAARRGGARRRRARDPTARARARCRRRRRRARGGSCGEVPERRRSRDDPAAPAARRPRAPSAARSCRHRCARRGRPCRRRAARRTRRSSVNRPPTSTRDRVPGAPESCSCAGRQSAGIILRRFARSDDVDRRVDRRGGHGDPGQGAREREQGRPLEDGRDIVAVLAPRDVDADQRDQRRRCEEQHEPAARASVGRRRRTARRRARRPTASPPPRPAIPTPSGTSTRARRETRGAGSASGHTSSSHVVVGIRAVTAASFPPRRRHHVNATITAHTDHAEEREPDRGPDLPLRRPLEHDVERLGVGIDEPSVRVAVDEATLPDLGTVGRRGANPRSATARARARTVRSHRRRARASASGRRTPL